MHERKWLSVEYRNARRETTRYWVGIRRIDPKRRRLEVRGMHLGTREVADLTILVDSIVASSVVDDSYFATPRELVDDIERNEDAYASVFGATPNLKVLDYLADCNKLNSTPYTKEFAHVEGIDEDSFQTGAVALSDAQFAKVIERAQGKARRSKKHGLFEPFEQIAINVLSVHTPAGLYVIAYRQLRIDPERRQLVIGRNTVFCYEFSVRNGRTVELQSIRRFIDEADLYLLDDFASNRETVKDLIAERIGARDLVDDEPHILTIARDMAVNLRPEYDAICDMFDNARATVPMKAFFGDLTKRPVRRKEYPLVLLDRRINLDQLLATHQAMKYPVTYVQGPPGTGKTTTIVNILVNALFNERTVLFAAYNNHPVDGVVQSLQTLTVDGEPIPFPILRLGDRPRTLEALDYIKRLYEGACGKPVLDGALEFERAQERQRSKALTELLKNYEHDLELAERKECIEKLADSTTDFGFSMQLQSDQLGQVEAQIAAAESPEATLARALELTESNIDELLAHLMQLSVRHIKRLGDSRSAELRAIVMSTDPPDERVDAFNHFLCEPRNLKVLLRIFPIIATTCISARRLGQPEASFDMTVIDEASQSDIACSLIPVVRGRNLVLVGDPAQLSPVVVVDKADNAALRRSYGIPDEYDFVENSAYKTFLACDPVSNEILLHEHYRCDEAIIDFNNRKYYNGRLEVKSGRRSERALQYFSIEMDTSPLKNTAPAEADAVVRYVGDNRDKSMGVITPFANQREYLTSALRDHGFGDVTCGTVHTFQGDEKDVILFSLALTDRTTPGTYEWLAGNRELINVATSRARDELVVFGSDRDLERLHATMKGPDDIYELVQHVKTRGTSEVTPRAVASRALGIKPYSTRTEAAFLENLNHALGNIFTSPARHTVHHEVAIAQVFGENIAQEFLFYSGRFDFVVYEVAPDGAEIPILAIELDGKEHRADGAVAARDRQKNEICQRHGFELIRVENTYARRYHHIKGVLEAFFASR
ncbi:MAG: AAA family ATPase [Eggerthellaceae bacterium]|nr:AAA family ATPase [Eggerthellaceae bacterium]